MTAVEWFFDELYSIRKTIPFEDQADAIFKAFNQAKEMEKEQIIKAYEITKFGIFAMTDTGILDTANKSGEQYYNETFKSK